MNAIHLQVERLGGGPQQTGIICVRLQGQVDRGTAANNRQIILFGLSTEYLQLHRMAKLN